MTWLTHESSHVAAPLKTIANARPHLKTQIEHIVTLPILCPVSNNPALGSTLAIAYTAGERILEIFALEAYIQAYHGHTIVRDMEFFVQVVGEECAKALQHGLISSADIIFNGLAQRQRISVQIPSPLEIHDQE